MAKNVDVNSRGFITRKIGRYRYVLWDTTSNYNLSESIRELEKKHKTKDIKYRRYQTGEIQVWIR